MEKVKERNKKYEVSVRETNNGYFEARMSVRLSQEKTRRIQKGGVSVSQSVYNLLIELYKYINQLYKDGVIATKIDDVVVERLSNSIYNLKINEPKTIQKVYEVINLINDINASFSNIIPLYSPPPNNILQQVQQHHNQLGVSTEIPLDTQNSIKGNSLYTIDEVILMWKKHELQLCVQTDDNPRPLSPKTVDGYIKLLDSKIIPFLKAKRLIYIRQVKGNILNELLKSLNGYHNKRNVHIVCMLIFRYLANEKIIKENPMNDVNRPVRPAKTEQTEIISIDPEYYYDYVHAFEQEGTDVSLLFDTIICTGCRPEEACRIKMDRFIY